MLSVTLYQCWHLRHVPHHPALVRGCVITVAWIQIRRPSHTMLAPLSFPLGRCKKWVFSSVPQYRMRKRIRTVPLGFKKVYFYFFLNVKDVFVRHQRREDHVSKSRADVPCASQNPQNANGTRCPGARTETEKPMCLAISAHFQPTSPSRLPTRATTDLGNHVTGTSDLAIPSMQRAGTSKTKGGDSRTMHLMSTP